MTVDEIRQIADPAERVKQAEGFIRRGRLAIDDVQAIRDEAILELSRQGWTQRKIAAALGLSAARVAQIAPKGADR